MTGALAYWLAVALGAVVAFMLVSRFGLRIVIASLAGALVATGVWALRLTLSQIPVPAWRDAGIIDLGFLALIAGVAGAALAWAARPKR